MGPLREEAAFGGQPDQICGGRGKGRIFRQTRSGQETAQRQQPQREESQPTLPQGIGCGKAQRLNRQGGQQKGRGGPQQYREESSKGIVDAQIAQGLEKNHSDHCPHLPGIMVQRVPPSASASHCASCSGPWLLPGVMKIRPLPVLWLPAACSTSLRQEKAEV